MMDWIVLMAAMPSAPAFKAARAGIAMSVMFGVILAHTGFVDTSLTQPTTCTQAHTKLDAFLKVWTLIRTCHACMNSSYTTLSERRRCKTHCNMVSSRAAPHPRATGSAAGPL